MSSNLTEDHVNTAIAQALKLELTDVHDGLAYQSIPEWGSLNHVTLMVRLAEEFGIGQSAEDARRLVSVAKIKRRLGLRQQPQRETAEEDSSTNPSTTVRIDRGLGNTILDTTRVTEVGSEEHGPIYRGHDSLSLFQEHSLEEAAALLINGRLDGLGEDEDALIAAGKSAAAMLSTIREVPAPNETVKFVRSLQSLDVSFARSNQSDQYEALRREGWALLGAASTLIGEPRSLPGLSSPFPLIDSILDGIDLKVPRELASDVLRRIMILQADNGASASTLALRVAISAGATLQEAISAATVTFGGALHGGALKSIVEFLEDRTPEQVKNDAQHMIDAGDPVPGFGHRVYRMGDPRAAPMKDVFERLAAQTGEKDYVEKLRGLREVMRRRESLGAAANYDLYAGPAWRLIGLKIDQLIPLFSTARMIGWIAHAVEQRQSNTLIRPQLSYVGNELRAA